jgi:nitrogen fixation protein FixH
MDNQDLLLTLGIGVVASFILFFIFRALRQSGKLAALLTILLVEGVYIPWSAIHWEGLDVFAIHFAFFTMTAAGLGIIFGGREGQEDAGKKAKGRFHWVPATIVGFFLVLATVDSVIITLATQGASADFVREFLPAPHRTKVGKEVTSAFSGTVARDFQKNTSEYNQYVTQLKQQSALGWRIMNGWVDNPEAGKPSLFRLRVIDDEGLPVTGAQVSVQFLFAADSSKDIQLTLPEGDPGAYGLPVNLPVAGAWMLLINITHGKDVYEAKGETRVALGK